jgi:hypothetical protein
MVLAREISSNTPQLTPGHLLTPSIKPFYACRHGISRVKPGRRCDSKFVFACVNSMRSDSARMFVITVFTPFLGPFNNVQLKNILGHLS